MWRSVARYRSVRSNAGQLNRNMWICRHFSLSLMSVTALQRLISTYTRALYLMAYYLPLLHPSRRILFFYFFQSFFFSFLFLLSKDLVYLKIDTRSVLNVNRNLSNSFERSVLRNRWKITLFRSEENV